MEKIRHELMAWVAAVNLILANCFGRMAMLLYIVIGLMGMDLVTRMYAAGIRSDEKIESRKILKGLYRKLGLCFLIILSLILDMGLRLIAEVLNIGFAAKIIFTNLTLAWLFVRELISNLENLQCAGVELPGFIMPALTKTKEQVEKAGNIVEENNKKS